MRGIEETNGAAAIARALGCEDEAQAGAPAELALAGRHRLSRYALIFRVDPLAADHSRLRGETRARFPGLEGATYRALVIGTRGHALLTRRILAAVKRRAERPAGSA